MFFLFFLFSETPQVLVEAERARQEALRQQAIEEAHGEETQADDRRASYQEERLRREEDGQKEFGSIWLLDARISGSGRKRSCKRGGKESQRRGLQQPFHDSTKMFHYVFICFIDFHWIWQAERQRLEFLKQQAIEEAERAVREEEARIKREEAERKGKIVISVFMPQKFPWIDIVRYYSHTKGS